MSMRTSLQLGLFAVVTTLVGCAKPPPLRPFDVEVKVITDENEPVPGAAVTIGQRSMGASDDRGRLLLHLPLAEGAHVALNVEPPQGYKTIDEARPLVLHRISRLVDGKATEVPMEHVVRFAPLQRHYAVLVDVGQPNMVVEAFGAQQAVTNTKGVASFVYNGTPGDELAVRVSSDGHPELAPKVVSNSFVLAPRSEAYLVQGRFEPAPTTRSRAPLSSVVVVHKYVHPKEKSTGPHRL
jgi:hypothetical protein